MIRMTPVMFFLIALTGTYTPASAQSLPVFFGDRAICLTAKPGEFQSYQSTGQTRLAYWQGRVKAGTATFGLLTQELCANARTVDKTAPPKEQDRFREIRLAIGHNVFFVDGQPVADGDCGNDFESAEYVPRDEVAVAPKPPAETKPPADQQVEKFSPPSYTPTTRVSAPASCSGIQVTTLDAAGTTLKFTAQFDQNLYFPGHWEDEDGFVLEEHNDLLVSAGRLEEFFGKKSGTHTLHFVGEDFAGNPLDCSTPITFQKHQGRYWLFKVPGINCLYAYTADIRNWSLAGSAEKLGCAAAGAGAYFLLGEGGVVAGKNIFQIIDIAR